MQHSHLTNLLLLPLTQACYIATILVHRVELWPVSHDVLHELPVTSQEIMAREQELLLEEFIQFVGLLDGRTDLTVQHAKLWTMDELMESIHPV